MARQLFVNQMIIFKCDRCEKETRIYEESKNNGDLIPSNGWVSILGSTIHNTKEDSTRGIIYSSKNDFHFCSKGCLHDFFYKPR